MPIYRNLVVTIPAGAYVEKGDRSVFIKDKNEYDPVRKYNVVRHTVIGRAIDESRMYPNHNYRMRYPAEFQLVSGEKESRQVLRTGLYAVVLSLIESTGLYRCLSDNMGIENANLLLDFCQFSILHHSSVADRFQADMAGQQIFSRNLKSGKDLSQFFNHEGNEERLEKFKRSWGEACRRRGIEEVWLAIDGSNNDCAVKEAAIAERGHAKSGKDVAIVSYLYAVDSKDGSPITFDVYRGGCVDSKAVIKMIGWLDAYQIKVKGVVVDRGFATQDVLKMLDASSISYVAMLKGDNRAHRWMLAEYGARINRQFEHMLGRYYGSGQGRALSRVLLKNDPVMYGISSKNKIRLFAAHDYEAYVSLIFDGHNGEERQEAWFKKVSNTAIELQRRLDTGKNKVQIPTELKNCLEIQEKDGLRSIIINQREVQNSGDHKGFSSLATSEYMEPAKVNDIYTLRNSVEEDFSIVKTQLGYGKTGTHSETGIKTKIATGFVASIIRNELMKAAKRCQLPTNQIIKELNFISLHLNSNDQYYACHVENERQKSFLAECGVLPSDLDRIAEDENTRRASKEPNPFHKFPVHAMADEQEPTARKGRDRPEGSEEDRAQTSADEPHPTSTEVPLKRGRGRPKGSKNKVKAGA